jgi:hypothetical protein
VWNGFATPEGIPIPEIPAIYRIEGDTLVVCNGGPNGLRPREFRPGDGALADLLTLERPSPVRVVSDQPGQAASQTPKTQ